MLRKLRTFALVVTCGGMLFQATTTTGCDAIIAPIISTLIGTIISSAIGT